ncbi:MAG TPA: ABC transporter ATP-binding protein [Polyangiales bacterium]
MPGAVQSLEYRDDAPPRTISGIAPARDMLIEIADLSHAFKRVRVLSGLSFGVMRGEIFGLLGPNGCGKSTTLRVLTGLLVPDSGELRLLGEVVTPGGRALRRQIGVVFQSPSLDGRLSARENLNLSAALSRVPSALIAARVNDALSFAQLSDRSDDLVNTFSGGMKRRLEIARALLHEPQLLLLDEPTSGLDEPSFQRTWQRILALRERMQLTVLLTTHRAEEAALCDRVAILDRGRVIALDAPAALVERVAGDVLTLEVDDLERAVEEVQRVFGIPARIASGKLIIEHERGHELIPRLVEALTPGSIRSLSMHRPSLADVFVQLTGRPLGEDTELGDG